MRVKIFNDKWNQSITDWLIANAGRGNWREWINPFRDQPYRMFEIDDEQTATAFKLRWQ